MDGGELMGHSYAMDLATAALITSGVTAIATLGAAAAATVAIRAQARGKRRQHDLDNLKWLHEMWNALRLERAQAARYLLGQGHRVGIAEVLNFLEMLGYLVRKHYLELASVQGTIGVFVWLWWTASAPVIEDNRRAVGPQGFGILSGYRPTSSSAPTFHVT